MVERKPEFTQVCVWPACFINKDGVIDDERIKEFETMMEEQFKCRFQFLEEVTTKPDLHNDGTPVLGTGGRIDLLFSIHSEDIGKFAVARLQYGIRWLEDVVNGDPHIYNDKIKEYMCWGKDEKDNN